MLRVPLPEEAHSQYLIEEFAVSCAPAMTTLETIRKQATERAKKRQGPRRELLAFANPRFGDEQVSAGDDMATRLRSFRQDFYTRSGMQLVSLPETEQEAIRIASLFGPPNIYSATVPDAPEGNSVVFTGSCAGEEAVKSLLGGHLSLPRPDVSPAPWRYLVFSTHGLADTRNGMLSCLALSTPAPESEEDGFLQAQEVLDLQLDADLVMLSACQTGLGRLRGGEGLVGLSTAFFIAGAESLCASLWQVPTGPTRQLTTEFFRRLQEGNPDRAEALRQTQLEVLRNGKDLSGKPADYSSPFCWAAFVLMGEYRTRGVGPLSLENNQQQREGAAR